MALGRSNSLSINTGATNSLFGNATTNTNNANTGGLFGNTVTQPSAGGSIFGNKSTTQPAPVTSSLFGASNAQQQQQQQQQQQPATSSIFGQSAPSNNLFGQTNNPTNTSSLFGQTTNFQPQQQASQAPSLLGATMRAQENQAAPYGRLSMGQGNAGGPSVAAAKVNFDTLRSTTRFDDCVDPVREALEHMDALIQTQEHWARQVEALVTNHDRDIDSLGPDVELVKDKAEAAEQALALDAGGVDAQREVVKRDHADFARCERIITNLTLPRQYHYSSVGASPYGAAPSASASANRGAAGNAVAATGAVGGGAGGGSSAGAGAAGGAAGARGQPNSSPLGGDTDLIGNYLAPLAVDLARTMAQYADNLTEIENHLRVIEASAVSRAQHLAQRRAGVTNGVGGGMGDETVRELAETLRGFEHGILDTAGVVGECREGVNELLLGRLGNGLR